MMKRGVIGVSGLTESNGAGRLVLAASLIVAMTGGSLHAQVAGEPDADAVQQAKAFQRLVQDALPVPKPRTQPAAAVGAMIDFGRGAIPIHVPASYDPETPTPLVILLHGYMNNGQEVEDWMQLSSLVDEFGFLYLYPTGLTDFFGFEYWNATDACCDLFGSGVDDSSYLRNIIDVMQSQYNVDPRRIHFVGHSNGGFMSYRMACDHADVVASIASLAGATYLDASDCTPAEPVHTLQMHGTADTVIAYNGGSVPLGGVHPGAVQTTETWAAYNGCAPNGVALPDPLDLDASIPGAETQVMQYATDCTPGGSAELWTINGGPHSPNLTANFNRLVIEFLFAHPKPAEPVECPADIDGNGVVGFGDLTLVLSLWGACPGCPADINGDGDVGFADLTTLLSVWGPC